MPNFKSADILLSEQIDISAKAEPSNLEGKLPLVRVFNYLLTGAEAVNDTIQLFDLPAGCVVIPQLSSVTCNDPGTTLTLDVGDSLDVDRYARSIVLNNGGVVIFGDSLPIPVAVTFPYLPAETSRVFATVRGAAGLILTQLTFAIAYRIKG